MATLPLQLAVHVMAQLRLPGEPTPHVKPQGSTTVPYVEFLERNTHIIYPVLAVVVLVVIAAGILQAWRTQDLDGAAKSELKREIMLELRKQMGGVTAEALARTTGVPPFRVVRLLEEMQADGLLLSHTSTDRLTVWQIKGVGQQGHRRRAGGR